MSHPLLRKPTRWLCMAENCPRNRLGIRNYAVKSTSNGLVSWHFKIVRWWTYTKAAIHLRWYHDVRFGCLISELLNICRKDIFAWTIDMVHWHGSLTWFIDMISYKRHAILSVCILSFGFSKPEEEFDDCKCRIRWQVGSSALPTLVQSYTSGTPHEGTLCHETL